MKKAIFIFSCFALFSWTAMAQRSEQLLEKNWKFTKGEVAGAAQTDFNDSKWETVDVPHDLSLIHI